MKELARAKVNLSLHIIGKRADGLHLLDSLVVFPKIGDVLQRTNAGFTISGPFAKGLSLTDNLVLKAVALVGGNTGFHLEKNLPVASGIGGGSADAAAALRLLGPPPPNSAALGADVPACLLSAPLRMQGIGERLTLLPPLPEYAIVLVNSGEAVSTAAVFKALENIDNPAGSSLPAGLSRAEFFAFIARQRNDMQQAAIEINSGIATVLASLQARPDCAVARMSGSGGTCFGLFEHLEQAEKAAAEIKRSRPDWWVVAAQG